MYRKFQNIKNIGLVFVFSVALFSCEKNVEEEVTDPLKEAEETSCDQNISFSQNINPILVANCIECHGGNQAPNLSTFSGVNANASRVKSAVVSRRMPQGGSLSNAEIEQISCWVENGALNN